MTIELKITTHPKFTLEELALKLASALQGSIDAQCEIEELNRQISSEKKKKRDLKDVIKKVEDFKENPPKKISRMEPLLSYDIEMIRKEISTIDDLTLLWETDISMQKDNIKDCQKQVKDLQILIKEGRDFLLQNKNILGV